MIEPKYGPQLATMGMAVLLIETYDSRRDLATGFIERVLNITETMFVADAYAALTYLAARPEIDPRRVVLVGFSYGGMATQYAMLCADCRRPGSEWAALRGSCGLLRTVHCTLRR